MPQQVRRDGAIFALYLATKRLEERAEVLGLNDAARRLRELRAHLFSLL